MSQGGTGLTSVAEKQVLIGGAGNTITQSANFAFDSATNALSIATSTLTTNASTGDLSVSATGDINLLPGTGGSVIIGTSGAGVIGAEAGQTLTLTGHNTLVLESTSGDIVMTLPSGSTDKVTVAGPTATEYATGLAAEDLTNKQYVDTAINNLAALTAVRVVKTTVNLGAAGTTSLGSLPANASILRVKVQVSAADTGTATLTVGKVGSTAAYMTDVENDPQTVGLYIAELYAVEAAAVEVVATVAGTAVSGTATVIVEYHLD